MADFATVAELEAFLGTTGLGTRGTAMLGYASSLIRLYCRQDLDVVTGRQEEYAGDLTQRFIVLTQVPVTAVSAITVDAVAFTEFWWDRWGTVVRTDEAYWDEGPIIITYDSGYGPTEDEMVGIKTITLEVAARALTGSPETFGLEVQETRGVAPAIFLTEEEKAQLGAYSAVGVG